MTARRILLALAASVLLPAAANAATAFASVDLNVRNGPSTGNRVVDVLRNGERVEVDHCNRGYTWCHVSHSGPDGWVAARYLNDRRYGSRRPLNRFGFSLNIPELNLRIGTGPRGPRFPDGRNGRDGRGDQRNARVCFYEDFNYKGRHFCADEGRASASLSNYWNDRISSIRVMGDARVRVCEDDGFSGRCHVVTRDRSALRGRNNDIISSYRVM